MPPSFPCGFWLWTLELGSSGLPRKHFCLSSQISAPRSGILTSAFPDHFICNVWATLYFWQCKMNSFCLEISFTGSRAGWDRMELKPLYHRVNEVESKVIFYWPSGCLASYPVCCAADKRCCQVWKFIYDSRFHFNDFLPLFAILAVMTVGIHTGEIKEWVEGHRATVIKNCPLSALWPPVWAFIWGLRAFT